MKTIVAILAGGVMLLGQSAPTKTVWDGVYTSDQANRGQSAYREACVRCHEESLMGSGNSAALVGKSFLDRWREDDLVELFDYIRVSMPKDGVGTVSEETKLDIFTYILKENEFPSGNMELKTTLLGSVQLVGKDGPKPLPSLTIVRAVGCLTKGADNVWVLNNAPEPSRTQRPDETSPLELKSSREKALGTLSFKLPGLDFAIPGVKPDAFKGHKVQAKGAVYRQPKNDRINVRSLTSLSESCGP